MDKKDEIVPEYWKNLSLENIVYLDDEGVECVEEWRDISEYEKLYQISDCGRVKSLERIVPTKRFPNYPGFKVKGKIKPSFDDGKGYRRVEISKGGVNHKYFVHQLVGIAFIPNPENKPQVNHMWGRKSDNRKKRLEWATKSEDRQHAIRVLGAGTGKPWKGCKPEDHPMFGRKGKDSPNWGKRGELHSQFGKKYGQCKTSVPIICKETGVRYESITDAANKLNISERRISESLKGFDRGIGSFVYENHTRKISPIAKKIICLNTGEVFDSITDAALKLGATISKISLVLRGKRTHTKQLKFEYYNG